MRQKVILIFAFIGLLVLLIGLNAFSFSQKERPPDSESNPNRSTFNSGTTGSQAFFTLLAETGRDVVRWQEPPANLLPYKSGTPATFVVIGPVRRQFTEAETSDLLAWVVAGGHLVVIDRQPPEDLVRTTVNWKVNVYRPATVLDEDEAIALPVQPSLMTAGVNSVRLSQFAGMVKTSRGEDPSYYSESDGSDEYKEFDEYDSAGETEQPETYPAAPDTYQDESEYYGDPAYTPEPTPYDFSGDFNANTAPAETPVPPPPRSVPAETETPPATTGTGSDSGTGSGTGIAVDSANYLQAPVVHMRAAGRDILAQVQYGEGRITYLTDPFVVSNTGIGELDNVRLAVNVVGADSGMVAFDEYHHGFGSVNNRLLEYFSGTPVVSIFLQLLLVTGFVLFTQSRRFARVVPEPEPDRHSRLEYVSAMAELQHRTKAFDLAIENIYTDFRRRASRMFGVDATHVKYNELAENIAQRTGGDAQKIGELLFECEDAIRGEPVSKRRTVQLIEGIREIEKQLGLRRPRADGAV